MSEEAAKRYAGSRPGFTLISYGDVGLPYYRIRLRAQILERKALPTMQEMAMRAVSIGLTEASDVRGVLGLDQQVFDGVMVELIRRQYVWSKAADEHRKLSLSPAGAAVLKEAAEVQPADFPLEVHYDGLLRRVVPLVADLLEPRRLRERGVREIPPAAARPPEASDLEVEAIEEVAIELRANRRQIADVLEVKRIDRRFRMFRPATLLVFRADDGSENQATFVIDGEISPEHESAAAQANLEKKIGIAAPSRHDPARLPLATFGQSWRGSASRSGSAEDAPPKDAPSNSQSSRASRILETYEHPQFLKIALEASRKRLVILSPWITTAVVDQEFLKGLRSRLVDGVEVYLGWGLSKSETHEPNAHPGAYRRLQQLDADFKNFRFARLGHLHSKILVSDQSFGIITSFNWLSFRGDPTRTYRDERGYLLTEPREVDDLFRRSIERFPDSRVGLAAPGGVDGPSESKRER